LEEPAALTLPEPPTAALGASPAFVVELEAFSGPLDLLLHLLREEELEISDIPIARIADQFLHVIHDLGLNQAADYLEMAGRLLRLKAQMLLPRRSEDDGWEDPRAELVRRLLEYQQIREVALWLGRAAERREQLLHAFRPFAIEHIVQRLEPLGGFRGIGIVGDRRVDVQSFRVGHSCFPRHIFTTEDTKKNVK